MLRREQIERLKERYPAGTVVRLGQMEGEHQMPSGMEGKVIGVDDIGQIHVEWENGSTLALNVEEDDFTVVPQKETLSEKKCREFLGKVNEILKETDFYRYSENRRINAWRFTMISIRILQTSFIVSGRDLWLSLKNCLFYR